MKIVFSLLLLTIALTTSVSCNKSWHCTCTDTTTNKITHDGDFKSMYESTARPQCEQYGSATISCKVTKK